ARKRIGFGNRIEDACRRLPSGNAQVKATIDRIHAPGWVMLPHSPRRLFVEYPTTEASEIPRISGRDPETRAHPAGRPIT
ncbi:MAG: hypothetical protein ACJ787_05255, partial [Myxococcales bacterium]